MRGPRREKLLRIGKVLLVTSLAITALLAIATKRLGWTNYWGGFVYAPFALVIAVLVTLATVNRPRTGKAPRRQRRRSVSTTGFAVEHFNVCVKWLLVHLK